MEVSAQLQEQTAFLPGNGSRYPLNGKLGGYQGRLGCCGEEKYLRPLPGIEPRLLGRRASSPLLHRLIPHFTTFITLLYYYYYYYYESLEL
jgi:hypothetical protein